jgi:transposase
MQFLYEDGRGYVVDENGIEPMDIAVETISSHIQFLMNKPPERSSIPVTHPVANERNDDIDMELCNMRRYTVYFDEDKTRFFHVFFSKCLNASTAARQLDIHIRAAQRCVKHYYEDPESIFEKKKKSGRNHILREQHKQFILNYIDGNPSTVVTEAAESLIQNFVDLKVSRSTVYNFMTTQCNLSIKQA